MVNSRVEFSKREVVKQVRITIEISSEKTIEEVANDLEILLDTQERYQVSPDTDHILRALYTLLRGEIK